MRQAVVIIHGIGEQRPMQTLRAFVAGALGVDARALNRFVFSKPDRIHDTLELRRLSVATQEHVEGAPLQKGCETDFYELYWQHLMSGTTWSPVAEWILHLAFCWKLNRRLHGRLRAARLRLLLAGLVAFVAVAALATGLGLCLGDSPLWRSLTETAIVSVAVGVVGWLLLGPLKWLVRDRAERAVLGYVGDAARYLTPDPPNIEARRDIRTAGLTLLRGLHDDELRRYERIILVGHSLGSVIAYDLITWFWQERHHLRDLEHQTRRRGTMVTEPGHLSNKAGGAPMKELADPRSPAFQRSQWSLWRRMRGPDHHLPWLITDLVTLGSPLAHADVLMAASRKAFLEGRRQREFPVCPPRPEGSRDKGLLMRRYKDKKGNHHVRILHHGAPFAVTRWTNLYFPGDIIGGPVARLFGSGVRDIELRAAWRGWLDRLLPARSHTRYWDYPMEKNASANLADALRLDDGGACCAKHRPDRCP